MNLDTIGIDEPGLPQESSQDETLAVSEPFGIPKRKYNPMDKMFPRRITALRAGVRDKTRVNVYMGGRFVFSLALAQVVDNGLKVGLDLSEEDEARLRMESNFGKAYQRGLEWALSRPHSTKELADYVVRKMRPGSRTARDQLGQLVTREYEGWSKEVAERVQATLIEKGYVNDEKFTRYFIENRRVRKGTSRKRLLLELHNKGIHSSFAEKIMDELAEDGFERDDAEEMMKIIAKKRKKYNDSQLVHYLVRQGFNYSEAREAVAGAADLA
jgi:regulatory protein